MEQLKEQANGAVETGDENAQEQEKGKLFTQEEVNGFIQARLGQMKKQASKDSAAEIEQRMKDLEAREMKLLVREKLSEKNMPAELVDVISCTSEEDLNSKLEAFQKILEANKAKEESEVKPGFQIGVAPPQSPHTAVDPIRRAMGLN